MLQLVRDRGRLDSYEPAIPRRGGEDLGDGDYYGGSSGQRSRNEPRSVASRVILRAITALVLMGAVFGAYVASQSPLASGLFASQQAQAASTTVGAQQPQPPVATQGTPPSATAQASPPPAARPAVPDVQGIVVLIRNAVIALHQANVTGDYSVLRDISAPGLQQAATPADLSATFADLRNHTLDLSQIAVVDPTLYRDPILTDQGFLRLIGFFPVGTQRVDFDLVFQMLNGRWALFGIAVNPPKAAEENQAPTIKPAKSEADNKPAMPDDPTKIALVRSSVLALNQANIAGDYSVLRELSAPGFQQANPLAQLGVNFSALRGRHLDLAPVAVIDPRLFRPAAIDKQGFLRLTGYFPSNPEQVNFDLAFQFSDSQWKLFGIGVNTSRDVPAALPPDTADSKKPPSSTSAPAGAAPLPTTDSTIPPQPRIRPKS